MPEVEGHIPCWQCKYDLHGLDDLGSCPECGLSISRTLLAHRYGQELNLERLEHNDQLTEQRRRIVEYERYQAVIAGQLERYDRILATMEANSTRVSSLLDRFEKALQTWERRAGSTQ